MRNWTESILISKLGGTCLLDGTEQEMRKYFSERFSFRLVHVGLVQNLLMFRLRSVSVLRYMKISKLSPKVGNSLTECPEIMLR